MVVIGDYNFTAHEDIVPNFYEMRSGNVHRVADPNVLPDDDFRGKSLIVILGDRFQPQSMARCEILTHFNLGQAPQVRSGTNLDFPHTEPPREKTGPDKPGEMRSRGYPEDVYSIFPQEPTQFIQNCLPQKR